MKKIGFLAVAIIFCGCTSKIQSNKASDFNQKIKKFYAIVKVADNTGKLAPKFSGALQEGLKLKGIDIQFEAINPLALENEQDLLRRVNNSKADGVLVMNQTESVTYRNSNTFYLIEPKASGGLFDIKIFVPGNPRPVWRGQMKASTAGYGNIGALSKAIAERVIQKLVEDGMI